MEFSLSEKPGTAANGHTAEPSAKLITTESNVSECMTRIKTSRESEIYLYNSEYLKNNYDKYIRDDFLYAFGPFYCNKVMKIPHLDRILKTECYHRETETKYRHYEFATYMENIITWLDLKLKYNDEESSKTNKKIQEQLFNTSSQELNDIITSPDITTSKNEDFPVNNTQNKIITSPDLISSEHDTLGNSTSDHKKGIDKLNNAQNKKITSPDETFPKRDTLENSTNDHKKGIDEVNNAQNKKITSPDETFPKRDTLENSTNDHKKGINKVNNARNKKITSADVTFPNHDIPGNSTNEYVTEISMENNLSKIKTYSKRNSTRSTTYDHKKEIDKVNNVQSKKITSPDLTFPKCDTLENSTNDHKKGIDKVKNAQNKKSSSPDVTFPKRDTLENSTNDHKKEIDKVNNAQNKTITSTNAIFLKHDVSGSSTNEYETEISKDNNLSKIKTYSTRNSTRSTTNDQKKGIDKLNNVQNKKITSPDVTFPKCDTLENSTNDHKKGIYKVNNAQNKTITSPDAIFVKHDAPVSLTDEVETDIFKDNNLSKIKTYSKRNSTRSTTSDQKKGIDKLNNAQNKKISSSDLTFPKYDTLGNSTNDHKNEIDEINSNFVNNSSAIESILTESQLKNPDISGDVKESTSDNLKIKINDKVEKLYPAQTSSSVIGDKISNMCLETSSKPIRSTRSNKQTNKKLDKTSTKLLKRSNSVTDSEHKSKKKKIEKPSPSIAERKTNTNNNKNSVKALNESIKQVGKNLYSRNSKGETKLHSACAKGKLDLVISLLEDGFNPNVKDNAGWTPMHEAVKCGNLDIVKELIKFGAYLNVPGFEYESPFYTAIKYGKFEISKTILNYGADANFMNMYGDNAKCLNKEKFSELLENVVLCKSTQICHTNYKLEETVIALNNVSLKSETVNTFCKQFNIKLVQNIWKEKQLSQVTHIIVPKSKNNTCDVNLECLTGIANGLFIVNENWISDSLEKNKLMKSEDYEVSGTTLFTDFNGPKISRISKQKLYPKLFDGINIHVCGSNGWNQFTLENLKKLVVEFGAKLLIRMPNPEDCPTNIIPYHCRDNDEMFHVSNIILYTMDSNRLIKYNMKHLKAFHISWFMEAVQKYNII
ncbi:unnamed protein product [Macrosiphum euphorbiae]|uniref:BRCT domain-containing protein n=1 Tax=Macrosiphum euphorbiae TaxID=13131 RepID=A0AAV0XER1_9HEMI|nr:unnamed protein product [Macrosiphum euphorbiae]